MNMNNHRAGNSCYSWNHSWWTPDLRSCHTRRNRTLACGGAVLVAVLFSGCAANAPAAPGSGSKSSAASRKKTDVPSSSAVRLNVQGEIVEPDEIWLPNIEMLEEKKKELSSREFEEFVMRQSADLISDKIAEMLLYQRARLRLTTPMEKKIDEYVDAEIRRRVTARYDGIQRRMERELEQQGWSLEGYRESVRRSVIISTYLDDELRPKVAEPTRAELLEAFHQVAESRRTQARRSMSLIDVRVSEFLSEGREADDGQKAEARALALARITEAQAEILRGLSFSDAARKFSHASNAPDGGSWGFVNPESVQDRYVPALAALDNLQQGQISGVIEAPDSYFLVRCDELVPASNPDFQSLQPEIREKLFAREYNRQIAELVIELRKTAKIEPENLEPFHAAVVADARARISRMNANP